MTLSSGMRIGHYEVLAQLGAGGMGEVYRARDTKLGRDVALKTLPGTFARDADQLARFEREARTLAALNHPNIAQVYGFEAGPAVGGTPVLVMELVEGEDLSKRIARGPVSAADSIPIVRQIADALEAAHEAGIVHRDLKPANIKIRDDGAVKVLDFGLAKALDQAHGHGPLAQGAASTMTSPAVTGLGVILGTASYMSPEQAKGRPVDRRADIWAFGAVWFELLTGRAPFPGETITDVIAAVVTRDPDWTWLPASTPASMRALIKRCLAKDPRQRLRDIGEVRLAIADGFARAPETAPASRSRAGGLGWMAAALAVILWGASTLWLRSPPSVSPSPAPLIKYDVPPVAGSSMRLDSRPAVAVSADGSAIVFTAIENGASRLYLRRRDDTQIRALPGTEGGSDPAFSPDGKMIAFAAQGDLMRMALDGMPASLAKVYDPRGLAWVDDQTIVFSAEAVSGLALVSAGQPPRVLTKVDVTKGDRTHRWPAVVPGGKAVLFTVGTLASPDNYDQSRIEAVILATGERRQVMDGASFVRVMPGGQLLFARAGTLYVVSFDPDRLVTSGSPVAVLRGVSTDTTTGAAHVALGKEGTLAYVPGGPSTEDRRIVWVDRKGAVTPIPVQPALYNDIRISPDGLRFAVVIGSSGSGDIWIYDTRSTAFTRFTSDGLNATPHWTDDGKFIYYPSVMSDSKKTTLMRRPADGSRDAEAVGTLPTRAYLDTIDRLQKTAFFNAYNLTTSAQQDILTLPIAGGTHSVLVGGNGSQFASALSPDGRWLAYESDDGMRPQVYVRDLAGSGGRWQVSTTGGEEPHWSADGNEIFYRIDARFMAAKVARQPEFRSDPPVVLFEGTYNLRSDTGVSYDLDHKTGRFAMIRPADATRAAATVRIVVNWADDVRRQVAQK